VNPSPHHPRSNFRFALRVLWLLVKGFAALFVILLALIVGALASFPQLFDNERARQILVVQLQDVMHRPVQIQGVVLSPQGIKLKGVQIFSKLAPEKRLLDSDIVVVTVKLNALMKRRLELNNVRLVSPHINLWRDENGVWNITDLVPSTGTVISPSGRFELPLSLAAEHTVIENGTLEIDDRLNKTSTKFEHFGLAVTRFDFDKPFKLALSFDNISRFEGRELRASLSLDGTMSLASQNWKEAYIRAERFEAKVDGHPIRGAVGINGFAEPSVTADILLPALGPAEWQNYLDKKFDLTLPPSHWKVKLQNLAPRQYKVEQLQASAGPLNASAAGSLDLSGAKPKLDVFATVSDFPLDALAAFKPTVTRFHLKGSASGEVGASGWSDKLVVHRAKVHLRGFSAILKNSTIERGDLDLSAANDFYKFSAAASHGAASAFGESFTDISGTVGLVGQDLTIDDLAFKWDDSRAKLKVRVTNLSKPKEVALSGNVDKISWEHAQHLVVSIANSISTTTASRADVPWLQTFKYAIPHKFPDTIGHFHIGQVTHANFQFKSTDILWDLHGVTPSLKGAGGDVKVGFGPGRVNDIQAVQESNKFLRIVFLPYIYMYKISKMSNFTLADTFPKELDFNRIEGQYTASQGVVTTHFTLVDSPATMAVADGTADFAREQVNMTVLTRLTKTPKALPEWWVDEKGRPSIGFRVTGDLGNPTLEIRLKKIGEHEIEDRLAQGRARAAGRFVEIEKLKTLEESK
jgi:hypothetical protein